MAYDLGRLHRVLWAWNGFYFGGYGFFWISLIEQIITETEIPNWWVWAVLSIVVGVVSGRFVRHYSALERRIQSDRKYIKRKAEDERYRIADDTSRPIVEVVEDAYYRARYDR